MSDPAARPPSPDLLAISPRIRAFPIIHGSGDFAIRVRDELLARPYDCLAVPLPPSFQPEVESAVEALPAISAVVRPDDDREGISYVPIDPCQGVIAGIRAALGERIPRAFIDLETSHFPPQEAVFPDPYAVKSTRVELFAAALLPTIPTPEPGLHLDRIAWMASELRQLERLHRRILLVCSILDWPWIRDAYARGLDPPEPEADPFAFTPIQTFGVSPETLAFLLGELPFLTGLYERGRIELTDDENLSVDGVKEMLLAARDRLRLTAPRVADRLTPQLLSLYMRYVRNLSLLDRRLTPDLYTLVLAAKQTGGDDFALAIAETAREYSYADRMTFSPDEPPLRMGSGRADVPGLGPMPAVSRLPGQALVWRSLELRPKPPEPDRRRWRRRWDPYGMCSWPPEDDRIESFHRHVRDQARAILGADLARSEKFTTSVRDGIDIRETLRHWHSGDLYVKVIPPARGSIEAVVFLFETPADPDRYPHRATWYAEHPEESTLAFYATDPLQDMVGPGIARAIYGGAMFLYPPKIVPDIWQDRRLTFAGTLEERLIAGAALHTKERHVAVVSPGPPAGSWRRATRRFGRKLVHLPLKRFGGALIDRLRTFHVLNGKHVRSYAADFIRDL